MPKQKNSSKSIDNAITGLDSKSNKQTTKLEPMFDKNQEHRHSHSKSSTYKSKRKQPFFKFNTPKDIISDQLSIMEQAQSSHDRQISSFEVIVLKVLKKNLLRKLGNCCPRLQELVFRHLRRRRIEFTYDDDYIDEEPNDINFSSDLGSKKVFPSL